MSNLKIVIVDYGLGNIFSIQRALLHFGKKPLITDNHEDILDADRIILPGVGSFREGMKVLSYKGLDRILLESANAGKPILGICLGMQLLMSVSEEFGIHKGLNLMPGKVIRFPKPSPQGQNYKVPHVGWNQIFPKDSLRKSNVWSKTILQNNLLGDFFYFAHSYFVVSEAKECVLAVSEYGGTKFCSVVSKKNIFGCQFHPELSGESGLKIYYEFLYGDIGDSLVSKSINNRRTLINEEVM